MIILDGDSDIKCLANQTRVTGLCSIKVTKKKIWEAFP